MAILDGPLPPALILAVAAALLAGRSRLRGSPAGTLARFDAAAIAGLVACAVALELAMGRFPFYRHGAIRAWSSDVWSDENSQQLADPYTLTHVVHGVILYALARRLLPRRGLGVRAVVAVAVEAAWEVFENTDLVIQRYRAATISLDYYGDSVLNSTFDLVAALGGFFLAARLPARWSVALVLGIELALAVWIRDNLALNVLMLVFPSQLVRAWQTGG